MFHCQFCYREAFLILNTCAKCDPALHKSHKAALASIVDWDQSRLKLSDTATQEGCPTKRAADRLWRGYAGAFSSLCKIHSLSACHHRPPLVTQAVRS